MEKQLAVFVPFSKFDEATGEVWGTLAEEQPDRSGEIMDYERSKPYFKAWSDSQHAASGGKSLGNVREMHGKNAVGKLIQLDFDDANKRINIGAQLLEPSTIAKARAGILTGFSMGGDYVGAREPIDHATLGKLFRFVANPQEASVVDRPCAPGSVFSIVKADGTSEQIPLVGRPEEKRTLKQVWTCAVPAHEHEMKADAMKCDGAETGPGLTVKVDATEAMKLVKAALAKATSPEAMKKCLYQIAQLAGALESVGWVHNAEEYEAAAEGDASPVPEKLKAAITALYDALSTMVDEEAAEWTSEEGMAMAVASTLEKINAKPQRLRELLTKRAEEEGMESKELQKIVGDSQAALAKVMTDGFEKIGTRVEGIETTIKTVTERLEKVEKATPASGGPLLRAVEKSADNAIGNEKAEQVPQDTHGLVKFALGRPIQTIAGAARPR